jgi:carbon-monoxide dehydrogenase large subunit
MTATTSKAFIGQRIVRREDERFLTGLATYLDDIELHNTAHVAFVRSSRPRAGIISLDVAAALAVPGVVRVLTSRDFPGKTLPSPLDFPRTTAIVVPHPVFASHEVQYVGQVIAAVIAESRAAAEDGAELIDVEYDDQDPIIDMRHALSAEDVIHESVAGNVFFRAQHGSGNTDEAFRAAANVIKRRVGIPRVVALPMETRAVLGSYDRGRDLLTMWCSAQGPHIMRTGLAHVLGWPEDRIHVIVPDVGGSFGLKGVLNVEYAAVALAATVMQRPVKWVEDRGESFSSGHHGRGIEADAEVALAADGRFLALRAQLLLDCGAYLLYATPNAGQTASTLLPLVYDFPAADITLLGVATNRLPTNPYRGAGRPEAAIIMEALVETAARESGRDAIDLRRRNLVGPDRFPYTSATGLTYDSGNFPKLLDELIQRADLPTLRQTQSFERLVGRIIGVGVGMYVERSGGEWESAVVSLEPGGRFIARIGSSPHGQGHETTFSQIAADVLAVDMDDIVVRWGDSSEVLRGVGTYASRSMTMGGNALFLAAHELRKTVSAFAAHLMGTSTETIVWERGVIRVANDRSREITLGELALAAYDPKRNPSHGALGLSASANFSSGYAFSSGAHLAVIEIDRGTVKISILRFIAVDDAGTIVNPLLAEGQVVGGIAQGIGEALFEDVAYSDYGKVGTTSLLDYSIVTADEMPPVETVFSPSPSPLNPLGIKGVGEGGACGAPAAISSAVADALSPFGVGPLDMPFTAEKMWRALRDAGIQA